MPTESFYPSINSLLKTDSIPESLSFVKDALNNTTNSLYYKNLQFCDNGYEGYYEMDIIPKNQDLFEMDLFGTGLKLIINPDNNVDNGNTSIHISLSYAWPVLSIINDFSIENFSYQGEELLNLFTQAVYIPDNQLLAIAIKVFEGGETFATVSAFVDKVNDLYSLSGADAIPYPEQGDYQDMINELLASITADDITDSFGDTISVQDIIEALYLNISQSNFLNNLKMFGFAVLQQPLMDYIQELLTPRVDGSSISHSVWLFLAHG